MAEIVIWQERYTTGDVLVADHKLEEHNTIVIQKGEHAGSYYLSGAVAKQSPVEDMPTKDPNRTITVRAVPLKTIKEERVWL